MDFIVAETNCYARCCMGDERYQKWERVSAEDLNAYFGIMMIMGLTKFPALSDYWRKDPLFHCSIIADCMSRDRFFEIHRYLHFVNNSTITTPSTDRLHKIRQFLTMIGEKYQALYHPHCQCAIDEAMVPYKGRSSLKQYMPQKPIKRGFKVWVRADSTNGYVSQFQVYTGKESSSTEKGLGSRVVKDLTATIQHRNHHVYCDNFFSSFQLFSDYLSVGIYACGTIRSNRKNFPSELTPYLKRGFPERGDSITLQSEVLLNLTISVWQDTKPVTVTATNCQAIPLDSVSRKLKTGEHHTYPCPEAITQYNKYMGGVDRNDQLRQYYHIRLKCRKYYKYLYWMLFDITISNAYILSSTSVSLSSITRSTKDFRSSLAKELLQGYCSRKTKGRHLVIPRKRFQSNHFPLKGDGKQHPCNFCKKHGVRKDTTWMCKECNLYFCHRGYSDTDCFLVYHKKYC